VLQKERRNRNKGKVKIAHEDFPEVMAFELNVEG
jgi:hypothetical protein